MYLSKACCQDTGSYLATKLIEQLAQGLYFLLPPQECQRAVPPPASRHVYLPSPSLRPCAVRRAALPMPAP